MCLGDMVVVEVFEGMERITCISRHIFINHSFLAFFRQIEIEIEEPIIINAIL